MLSDYPDKNLPPPSPRDSRPLDEVTKGRPMQKGYKKPEIQVQISRWIVSLGLSVTAAEALTQDFCEKIKKKALREGTRIANTTYELGYENSYIKIRISRSRPHDPEDLLGKFLFENNLKGEWKIVTRKKMMGDIIYTCKPQANKKTKKSKEKAAIEGIKKLNPRQAEALLTELLKMIERG